VIFDYYSPDHFGIHVAPSSHLESCDSAPEMLVQIPRSDGRMDLHLMITGEGPILFPMRTSTATLHDRLVAATQEIPPGSTREEALEHVKNLWLRRSSATRTSNSFISQISSTSCIYQFILLAYALLVSPPPRCNSFPTVAPLQFISA
jgi:hypothetical protein